METEQEKKEKKWVEHMKKLYHKDTKGWKNEQWSKWWHKCMKIQGSLNPNKSGHYARNTCNEGENLSRVHFQLKEEEQIKNKNKMIKTLSNFFGLKEGGSKKSRKSKASQKSLKVKSKSRKSKASQKSRQSRKQSKRLEREIQLSKEMSKRMSKKTPMIASSHGISLLKRSKRNMSKGRPLASARDFLLATSILTAALSPYDAHPMAQKSKIAPDTQVHLDWHKGQFPDKQLTSKQYKKLMKRSKRGKRLATIKEGGRRCKMIGGGRMDGEYTWECPFCATKLSFSHKKPGNLEKAIKFYDEHMKTAHKFDNARLAKIHDEVHDIREAAKILESIKDTENIRKIHNLLNSKYLNPQVMEPTTELPTQKNIEVQLANKDGSNTWWKASVIQDLGDELWVKWDGLEIEGMPQYELIPKSSSIQELQEGGKWSLKYKRKINCKRPKGFSQKQYCKRISKKKKKRRTKKNRKKRTKKRRRK